MYIHLICVRDETTRLSSHVGFKCTSRGTLISDKCCVCGKKMKFCEWTWCAGVYLERRCALYPHYHRLTVLFTCIFVLQWTLQSATVVVSVVIGISLSSACANVGVRSQDFVDNNTSKSRSISAHCAIIWWISTSPEIVSRKRTFKYLTCKIFVYYLLIDRIVTNSLS